MAVGYLTSSSLIEQAKREAMLPTNQVTFQPADFLAFANQEMRIALVPSMMVYHQEYLVRESEEVTLVANKNNYAIPYRAVGGKFREVFYKDTQGQLRSMTRVNADDIPYYQQSNFQNRFIYFYLQGNDVVLMPDVGESPVGSLIFKYYFRPNELVSETRVGTIGAIASTNTQGVITAISATGPAQITSVAHGLSSGNIVTISQSTSSPSINGVFTVTVIDADTFSIPVSVTTPGTTGLWTYKTTTFTLDQIPTGFSTTSKLDLLQTLPGHKTISFDLLPLSVSTTNKTVTFNTADLDDSYIVGDYLAFAGECIIPQVPADLHDVLAQRVATRCLQALGDQQGIQNAATKLSEMEVKTGILIDNRSEGQATKINNLRGVLRSAKIRKRGWI